MEGKWSFLVKCGICKEQKIQGKINLNLQGKEIARNGISKEEAVVFGLLYYACICHVRVRVVLVSVDVFNI